MINCKSRDSDFSNFNHLTIRHLAYGVAQRLSCQRRSLATGTNPDIFFESQPQVIHEFLSRDRPIYAKSRLSTEIPTVHVQIGKPNGVIGVHVCEKYMTCAAQMVNSQTSKSLTATSATVNQQSCIARLDQYAGSKLVGVWGRCPGTRIGKITYPWFG